MKTLVMNILGTDTTEVNRTKFNVRVSKILTRICHCFLTNIMQRYLNLKKKNKYFQKYESNYSDSS